MLSPFSFYDTLSTALITIYLTTVLRIKCFLHPTETEEITKYIFKLEVVIRGTKDNFDHIVVLMFYLVFGWLYRTPEEHARDNWHWAWEYRFWGVPEQEWMPGYLPASRPSLKPGHIRVEWHYDCNHYIDFLKGKRRTRDVPEMYADVALEPNGELNLKKLKRMWGMWKPLFLDRNRLQVVEPADRRKRTAWQHIIDTINLDEDDEVNKAILDLVTGPEVLSAVAVRVLTNVSRLDGVPTLHVMESMAEQVLVVRERREMFLEWSWVKRLHESWRNMCGWSLWAFFVIRNEYTPKRWRHLIGGYASIAPGAKYLIRIFNLLVAIGGPSAAMWLYSPPMFYSFISSSYICLKMMLLIIMEVMRCICLVLEAIWW